MGIGSSHNEVVEMNAITTCSNVIVQDYSNLSQPDVKNDSFRCNRDNVSKNQCLSGDRSLCREDFDPYQTRLMTEGTDNPASIEQNSENYSMFSCEHYAFNCTNFVQKATSAFQEPSQNLNTNSVNIKSDDWSGPLKTPLTEYQSDPRQYQFSHDIDFDREINCLTNTSSLGAKPKLESSRHSKQGINSNNNTDATNNCLQNSQHNRGPQTINNGMPSGRFRGTKFQSMEDPAEPSIDIDLCNNFYINNDSTDRPNILKKELNSNVQTNEMTSSKQLTHTIPSLVDPAKSCNQYPTSSCHSGNHGQFGPSNSQKHFIDEYLLQSFQGAQSFHWMETQEFQPLLAETNVTRNDLPDCSEKINVHSPNQNDIGCQNEKRSNSPNTVSKSQSIVDLDEMKLKSIQVDCNNSTIGFNGESSLTWDVNTSRRISSGYGSIPEDNNRVLNSPSMIIGNNPSWCNPFKDGLDYGPTQFAAFLCVARKDLEWFGYSFLKELESWGHRIFFPERDLPLTGPYYENLAHIVKERCNSKLIAIISKNYPDSDECLFLTYYMKHLDPAAHKNGIIPIYIDKNIENLPNVLQGLFSISYNKAVVNKFLKELISNALMSK